MTENLLKATIDAYDQHAEDYSISRPLVPPVIKRLDYFLTLLSTPNHSTDIKILDVGCGPGRDAAYLSDHGLVVTGIDLSQKLIDIARKNNPRIDFQVMDMRHLSFADDSLAGLWVNTSFLHLPKSSAAATLKEFNRVLVPGGILFLGLQSHKNDLGKVVSEIGDRQFMITTTDFNDSPRLFSLYDEAEIAEDLNNTGFAIIRLDTREEPDTHIRWINLFARKQFSK